MNQQEATIITLVILTVFVVYIYGQLYKKFLMFYNSISNIYQENLNWLNKNAGREDSNSVISVFFEMLEEVSEEL